MRRERREYAVHEGEPPAFAEIAPGERTNTLEV